MGHDDAQLLSRGKAGEGSSQEKNAASNVGSVKHGGLAARPPPAPALPAPVSYSDGFRWFKAVNPLLLKISLQVVPRDN